MTMGGITDLPEGTQATITVYVKSPGAGLVTYARLRGVTRVAGWAAKDLLEQTLEQMNAVTGLGDARPMSGPEINAYLLETSGREPKGRNDE